MKDFKRGDRVYYGKRVYIFHSYVEDTECAVIREIDTSTIMKVAEVEKLILHSKDIIDIYGLNPFDRIECYTNDDLNEVNTYIVKYVYLTSIGVVSLIDNVEQFIPFNRFKCKI